MALDKRLGDTCGNCHQKWPCGCDDPVRICGICGGDEYDCRCDERSGYDEVEDSDGYDEPFGFDPDEDYSEEDDFADTYQAENGVTWRKGRPVFGPWG